MVLPEVLIRALQRIYEPVHVGFHGRSLAEDDLRLVYEGQPSSQYHVPLIRGEVAISPLDRSLTAHVYFFNYKKLEVRFEVNLMTNSLDIF